MNIYEITDDFARHTTRSLFLTGKAGTGKTTFLKQLRKDCAKQMAVVAPTGVAAINAGGVTIHSFFQLPFTPFVPTPEGRRNLVSKLKMSGMKRKVLQELELLVIDEISMVRADVLDEIDTVLRHCRFRHNEPFGGVQLICIGDLYQLAPVAISEEWNVLAPYYRTPYFFDSMVVREHPLLYVEFDTIFRQKDQQFIHLLNAVRNNQVTEAELQLLQSRYDAGFNIAKHKDYILLTTHNAKAEKVNQTEMARLKYIEHTFTATIKGEFPEKGFPNNPELNLKIGAKVMFIANDTDFPRKYFNGKIGIVSNIDEEENIYVHCDDMEEDILVKPEIWENIRYSVNSSTKQIEEKKLGEFKQIPLRLAWAITVHKSQGLTFDKVAIDIEDAFTSGQVYVALSRCRSLEGITMLSPINRSSLAVNANVVDYANQKPSMENVQEQLQSDRMRFNEEMLRSTFSFAFCSGQANLIRQNIQKGGALFNAEAPEYILALKQQIDEIATVGSKFCHQLSQLSQQGNSLLIDQRVKAASDYFCPLLNKVLKFILESPVSTDDRELAKEYLFELETLHDEVARKLHIIKHIKRDHSTEHILALKQKFEAPKFKLKAKKSKAKINTLEVTLALYKEGMTIEEIAQERDLVSSTIEGHIAKLIAQKKISLYDFVTEEQAQSVKDCLQAGASLHDIYESLNGNLTYGQLRMIQSGLE